MRDQHKKLPQGSALEHGPAHSEQHEQWTRRTFLRNLGLAGGATFLLSKIPVQALASSPLEAALSQAETDRILVFVRLKGGNDGLNTIIPLFDYGTYQSRRPNLHIPLDQTLQLDEAFALPQVMSDAHQMWQSGQMKVAHNVGYPEQNLSHFRSTDIWASASDSEEVLNSGWLGRFFGNEYPDFLIDPPAHPPAIQVGGTGTLFFTNEEEVDMAMIINNPEQLYQIAQNGQLYDPADVPVCYYGEQLGYVRTVANNTYQYAGVINQAYEQGSNAAEYDSRLGEQLAVIARLIKGGLNTRIYMVTLDGFDTHANQPDMHPYLLETLSEAMKDFYEDLSEGGWDQYVLSATISEFGRRIEQNGSQGTDHGAAAPMLFFGPALNGQGFIGPGPDLSDVDEVGNLKFSTDFRQMYATLLEYWLCIDPDTVDGVLGDTFERVPELGIECITTSTSSPSPAYASFAHRAFISEGRLTIRYQLPDALQVRVRVFTPAGQELATLLNTYQWPGEHDAVYTPPLGWPMGVVIYTIEAGPYRVSGKAVMSR